MAQTLEQLAEEIVLREHSHKNLEMVGYLGKDGFGRLYIDTCPSLEAHLKNHVDGKERPGCRKYLDDLVDDKFLGHRVLAIWDVFVVDRGEQNEQSKLG